MPIPRVSGSSRTSCEKYAPPVCAWRITVQGRVQGTGFRPHVYRLARLLALRGCVRNVGQGVEIILEGQPSALEEFRSQVGDTPPAAVVESLTVERLPVQGAVDFTIDESGPPALLQARVLPDLATCVACRDEVFDPVDRRHGYPFTSCTACGPRYSGLANLPYDRPSTTMALFRQCDVCNAEYREPGDRRFHAQANACGACGPQLALWDHQGRQAAGPDRAVANAANLLRDGRILALKGLGGFQLAVRADNASAVERLRSRKNRPTKPFAVMVRSLDEALRLGRLGPAERSVLSSPANPIVLVQVRGGESGVVCAAVTSHLASLGLFLPTTPLHHLLLAAAGGTLVMTSGNRSDEPIVTDERQAPRRLAGIADAFLVHDRAIVRRVDDSVVRIIAGRTTVLRLARGYAPLPLPVLERWNHCPPLLAAGGHQKVAAAQWTGQQAVLAQHVGDLSATDTRTAFAEIVADLSDLYRSQPTAVARDLHPDYFTTRWADSLGKPVIAVQHHHAHAAACMAEHELLDREVLAFTWDGSGYGPDGTIWGGEVLRATVRSYRRVASLLPFPLPGGEAAVRRPNRTAFGLLVKAFGPEEACAPHRLARLGLHPSQARVLAALCARPWTPQTSSMGRLFDAIAALALGIREATYEGEAAVRLEAVADEDVTEAYPLPAGRGGEPGLARGDWRPLLQAVLADLERGVSPALISGRFHNAVAQWAAAVADVENVSDIILTGGCFQNRLLAERTREALTGRRVYLHGLVPPGDGGLAAGQLAVALSQWRGPFVS